MGIVGGVGGGEQPSEVFIASSPAPVTINARTRPCEGMRMSVRPSCDHVAAQVGTVRAVAEFWPLSRNGEGGRER